METQPALLGQCASLGADWSTVRSALKSPSGTTVGDVHGSC